MFKTTRKPSSCKLTTCCNNSSLPAIVAKGLSRHVSIYSTIVLLVLFCIKQLHADNTDTTPFFSAEEQRKILAHGPWPMEVPADPGNELSGLHWAEQLGRTLFDDTRLSNNNSLSCSSCHLPAIGFTDQRVVGKGVEIHTRNTQSLLNVGLQRWFGWDGGADSLWAATLRPMLSPIEMNADIKTVANHLRDHPQFMHSIEQFLRSGNLSVESATDETLVVLAAKAIAAYMRTISSGITGFDRYRNALAASDESGMARFPDAAKRGLKIFMGEANCRLCHFGPNFSNQEFHDTGRPFFTGVGQVDPGRYTGIQRVRKDRYNLGGDFNGTENSAEIRKSTRLRLGQSNWGQWRTPSLRNLTLTAPYTHDGSLSTLRDVVDAYAEIDPARLHSKGEALLKPLNLTSAQRNDLVIFLNTLSPPQLRPVDE